MPSRTLPSASSARRSSKEAEPGKAPAVPGSRYILFFTIAVMGCAVDLATKSWIFARLGNSLVGDGRAEAPIWLLHEVFGLETSLNEGALFGIGQGMVAVLAVLSIVAAVGVVYWLFFAGAARDLVLTIALASVTAGIFGNLYDRVGLPGLTWATAVGDHDQGDSVYAVRDWLHFKIDAASFDWPIFNIADSLLVCGAGLLVWHGLRHRGAEPPGTEGPVV